ncbi:ankyrin repeat protein [Seiridium cupressi]
MSSLTENEAVPHPFQKGDEFEPPVPGIQYYPEDPRIQQLNQACTDSAFEEFQRLLTEWCAMENPSPPHGPGGYPLGTVEPCLYHAIRMDRPTFVAHLLDIGLRLGRLAAWEASEHKCSPRMWQVFLDHGHFDISAPMEDFGLSPLGNADTATSSMTRIGRMVPRPRRKSERGVPMGADSFPQGRGSAVNSVPFVCSPYPPLPQRSDVTPESRLDVLRYLLDAGADPNARKWAHNGKGYASDFDWGSGLNAALANGRLELAEELLRRGARTDVPTCNIASQGVTAIALATRYMPALLPLVEECRARGQSQ